MSPRPCPAIWSAMATSAAHCGQLDDVPPTTNQPALHGLPGEQFRPLVASPGAVSSTPRPVTGSEHRYVPPTPVTSGSEAGHSTVGNGKMPGFLTGVKVLLAV